MYYQQGDVLLKRVNKLPEGLTEIKDLVLQHGETTGHKHQFAGNAAVKIYAKPRTQTELRITEIDGEKYIQVLEPSALSHEEHKTINVEPGIYQLDIVREYDYEKDEVRRVID